MVLCLCWWLCWCCCWCYCCWCGWCCWCCCCLCGYYCCCCCCCSCCSCCSCSSCCSCFCYCCCCWCCRCCRHGRLCSRYCSWDFLCFNPLYIRSTLPYSQPPGITNRKQSDRHFFKTSPWWTEGTTIGLLPLSPKACCFSDSQCCFSGFHFLQGWPYPSMTYVLSSLYQNSSINPHDPPIVSYNPYIPNRSPLHISIELD